MKLYIIDCEPGDIFCYTRDGVQERVLILFKEKKDHLIRLMYMISTGEVSTAEYHSFGRGGLIPGKII